ncbi:nmra-like family protein [Colletotrichum chrysophilum]|uniref:Nmra-like family protein n=1 Tax=Colletotrichum chrysophilum TaxID=1836956 RepID=A0AAD9AAP9_9PEZI|nr:nmra-like family protein [Colletotrichum chrysophilum]
MGVIAVAGGTGAMGRTIVEGLVRDGTHRVAILARKTNPEKEAKIGARIVAVDYSDSDQISTVLEANSINTVISTLNSSFGIESKLNLIRAANQSTATKRYVANVWGITYTPEESKVFPAAEGKVQAMQALGASSLEWTCFLTGFLSDYFVMPRGKSYMTPLVVLVDMVHNVAAIPGSGSVPVVLTYSFDIPKFVIRALALDHWENEMYIIGDKMTLNEVVALAEEVKGTKFSVTHDSMDNLKAGRVTELPSHEAYYPYFPKEQMQGLLAFFGIMWESGKCNLEPAYTLNQRFPDIETTSVRTLLESAWKGI